MRFGFRSSRAARRRAVGMGTVPPPPPPPPPIAPAILVIEGDSISSTQPGVEATGFYSWAYRASRPDKTIHIRAQGSRTIDFNGTNSLVAARASDLGYGPQVYTAFIGANDLQSSYPSAQAYFDKLAAELAPIRAAGVKVGVATVLPYNDRHPGAAAFNARRADYNPLLRANWASAFDFLIPFGDHPDLNDPTQQAVKFGDGVHPSGMNVNGDGGQDDLLAVYRAVIDPVMDGSARTDVPDDWGFGPAIDDAPASAVIERRAIVTGLSAGRVVPLSVTGGTARVGQSAFGAGPFAVMNGDVVTLRLPTAATPDTVSTATVAIGGVTRTLVARTTAVSAPVTFALLGKAIVDLPTGSVTVPDLPFEPGVAIVAVSNGGAHPSGVTIGGVAATPVQRARAPYAPFLSLWTAAVPGGAASVVVTKAANSARCVVLAGHAPGAAATPVVHAQNAPLNQSPPHLAPAMSVPASGFALALFDKHGGASVPPVTVATPATLIADEHAVYQSETGGIAMAVTTTDGATAFDFTFGSFARIAATFRAA